MDSDLVVKLNKVSVLAQQKILSFLKANSTSHKVKVAQELFNNCPIYIATEVFNIDDIKDKQNIGGYASNSGIYINEKELKSLNTEFETNKLIGVLIHEYAHMFRRINSSYGNMFEEASASIFAEMCINYSQESLDNNTLFSMLNSVNYQKAESQVRAILYFLNQKGLDNNYLIEYIIGNENLFNQKCSEIFGKEFDKYFIVANSNEDKYYDNISNNNSEEILINILENYIKNNDVVLKDYWDQEKQALYFKGTPTLSKSVVKAGIDSLRDDEKSLYKNFEYSANVDEEEKQFIDEERKNRIISTIHNKYSLENKNDEQIYSTLCDLSSYYIQHKNVETVENIIFLEQIRSRIPNIDQLVNSFIELRKYVVKGIITSESIFKNKKVSYFNLQSIIDIKLNELQKTNEVSQQVEANESPKLDPSKILEIKNKYNYLSAMYNVIINEHVYNEIVKIHNSIIEEINNRNSILEAKKNEKNNQELKKDELINRLDVLRIKKKIFASSKIKKLQNDILLVDDSIKNNSINISLIENRLNELKQQLVQNENYLVKLTGLNINKFYEMLSYIKTNSIRIDVVENELDEIKKQIELYNISNYGNNYTENNELDQKTL